MEHIKLFDNGVYYVSRLSNEDADDITSFKCRKNSGYLEGYLKNDALIEEKSSIARTYLIRDIKTDELVGYFSLKAGIVSLNENTSLFRRTFDTIPGVELANFALNISYIEAHELSKGAGKIIFNDFVLKVIENAKEWIGIDIVYIYSLPEKTLIENYRKYGFSRLSSLQERKLHRRIRPRYDQDCIFMFRQL